MVESGFNPPYRATQVLITGIVMTAIGSAALVLASLGILCVVWKKAKQHQADCSSKGQPPQQYNLRYIFNGPTLASFLFILVFSYNIRY